MASSAVPVDLLNPGQVFGCLGLAEAAQVLLGGVSGGFEASRTSATRFHVHAAGPDDPVKVVLAFLRRATVHMVRPARSENTECIGEVEIRPLHDGDPFPSPDPDSPSVLPAVLEADGQRLVVDHWGDGSRRDAVKFWGGAGGYPGAALLRDALQLIRDDLPTAHIDPFSMARPQSSSFRFDWRRDYIPIGIGFSLNEHAKLTPLGYPLTEILAAIGLTHARPERPDPKNKLIYRYGVLMGTRHPLIFLRAALGCCGLPHPIRTFRMDLGWPAKEGQSRCITAITEEHPV